MIWSVIQTIGKQGITFATFAILALLLGPKDFGILGMAMTWIAFIQVFSQMGFGAALIQRKNVTSGHYNTIFVVNVVTGIFLTFTGILLSWPCAAFFKTPKVQPIMAVLSLCFVVNSFTLTQIALAQRELRFRDLAIRDISASLIGGVVSVILALLKFGVWSLVIQVLITYTIGSILLWNMSKWRPLLREFSFLHVRELWPYSSKIFAFNIFSYFAHNTDKLIIAYLLGTVAVGLYTFAYQLVVYPISTIVGAIGVYLFPKFSKMQEEVEAINKSYTFTIKAINSVVMPFMVAVFFISPVVIPRVWGHEWLQAIPLIRIFTIIGILTTFISPVGQLMKALDRPSWLFNWSVFITITISIFMWIGVSYKGIVGAAIGVTIAYIASMPIIFNITNRLIRARLRAILNPLIPSILSSVLMGLLLLWTLNSKIFLSKSIILVMAVFIAILCYSTGMIVLDKKFVITMLERATGRNVAGRHKNYRCEI